MRVFLPIPHPTAHTIVAGSIAPVSRYTNAAEQKTLAHSAIRLLSKHSTSTGFPNLASEVGNTAKKFNEINADFAEWRPVGDGSNRRLSH